MTAGPKKPRKRSAPPKGGQKAGKGLPSAQQIMELIETSPTPVGKREIAKAFGLKGADKIALKRLLKDMAEEGLIEGRRTAFHRMGGVPRVTVLRVDAIEDGEAIAVPENWNPDSGEPPPRLKLVERKRSGALKRGDRVLARTEESDGELLAHPMRKLPARSEGILGVVEFDGSGKPWLAPVDRSARSSLPIGDLGGAEEGQLVLAETSGRSARAKLRVVEIFGDPLAPRNFSLIAIVRHGIPHVFPPEVIEEARLAASLDIHAGKREDLRDVPILAIDPADARDHDDAIWAQSDGKGGFRALVAIADVSFYVRPGGALDREARKRGNSVYFPDRVVPMLPEILSADVCSLKQGQDRAAMVCHLEIGKDGAICKFRFARALVRIARNFAYEDAQQQIDRGKAPRELRDLWACWKALAAARATRDPLELELPERRVILDEKGNIRQIALRERLDAHRVVEDFMIAANVAAAKALEAKGAPVIYRIHEPPSREKLIALRDYLQSLGRKFALGQVVTPGLFNRMIKDVGDDTERALLMEAVLRTQTQAYYGPEHLGHFGLSLASYAHFTSPIRRYADILVHRALTDAYGLEPGTPRFVGRVRGSDRLPEKTGLSDRDRERLGQIAEALSQTERRAMEAERETIDRYMAKWLSTRVGEVFETRITGVQPFGFFVTIADLGGDGLVHVSELTDDHYHYDEAAKALIGERSGQRYSLGDRLKLRLVEANPLTGGLRFALPESRGADASENRGRRRRSAASARGSGLKSTGGKTKDTTGKQTKARARGRRGRPANIRHQSRRR